jgi:hypothetical protein
VDAVLAAGYHTADIAGEGDPIGTVEMGKLICDRI